MKPENHLPLYGVGPVYAATVVSLTVAGMLLSGFGMLESGRCAAFHAYVFVVSALLIAFGALMWVKAVAQSKIDANILENRLVTTGVYAWVRNPVYSAFLFVCTGALLMAHNLWLLILPVLYWAFLTVLMKRTEEKWLTARYGAAYKNYCKRTNRCIPWFPRRGQET